MSKETPKAIFTCDVCKTTKEEADPSLDTPNSTDWHLISLTRVVTDKGIISKNRSGETITTIGETYLVCHACIGRDWWWGKPNETRTNLFMKLFNWAKQGATK